MAIVCASTCHRAAASPQTPAKPSLQVQIGFAVPPSGVTSVGIRELVRNLSGETLLISDRNGSTRPRLCAKWQWLNGGTVLRLTLKQGVTFHDGSPLDAKTAAVLLTQTFAEDKYAFTYRSVKQIHVLGQHTLQIDLARPEALLLEDLADAKLAKDKRAIGTGPFVIDGPVTEKGATLQGFTAYHQGRPGVERVEVKPYPSLRSAWTALLRGEINMLYEVSRESAPFVEAESSVRTYPMLRSYVNAVFFNVRHPVLARREVRQALSYAVDRDAIVRDVMGGRGERADSPVWKYHWAFSTAQKTYDYNPELARLKLDAAGFRLRPSAHGQMPSRLRFTCLIMGNDPRFERIALVLQKQLYDVGVDMQVEPVPLLELVDRLNSGRYDAIFFEALSGRSLTWLYRLWRSRPNPLPGEMNSGYSAADPALDRLRDTFTEDETKRAVGALQEIFYQDPPAIFVAWPQTSRAVSAQIQVPSETNLDVIGRIWRFQAPEVARR